MKKPTLFYGVSTVKTAMVADKIREAFGGDLPIVDIGKASKDDFRACDCLIAGTSTWFDGELPNYWDELLPEIEGLDLKGKKVAVFGLGDQKKYPDNFADGVGILADMFAACGAELIGLTSPEGYVFDNSRALKNGKLQGLIIDFENQAGLTDARIKKWAEQLKKEM